MLFTGERVKRSDSSQRICPNTLAPHVGFFCLFSSPVEVVADGESVCQSPPRGPGHGDVSACCCPSLSVPQRGSPRRLSTLSCAAAGCRWVSWAAVPRGGRGSLCSPAKCRYLKPEHCWPDQGFYVSQRDRWPEQMCRQCGSLLFRSLAESMWVPVGHARRRGCVQGAWLQLTSWRDALLFPFERLRLVRDDGAELCGF